MGIDDIVKDKKYEEDVEIKSTADASDLTMNEFDWKFVIAHQPWIADRLLSKRESDVEKAELIIQYIDEMLDEGHASFQLGDSMKRELERKREEIVEGYL